MKLIGMLTTYNNESTLPGALAVLDQLDGSVIVEGAYQHAISVGQSPRSSDETVSLCGEYIFSNPRAHFFQTNEANDTEQRNFALSKIKKLFGVEDTIVFIVDGDETYTSEQIEEIFCWSRYLNRSDNLGAHIWSRVSITDTEHRLMIFPRLFKMTDDCYFFDDNRMKWPTQNIQMNFTDRDENGILVLPQRLATTHHSYDTTRERFELKRQERISRHGRFVWEWDEQLEHPVRKD